MIDRRPVPGDLTDWYDDVISASPMHEPPQLTDTWPERKSSVLGPDGEPVRYNVPRRKIGFNLRPITEEPRN